MDEVFGYWFEYCPSNALLSSLPDMNDSFDRWFGGKEDIVQYLIWNSVSDKVESWPETPNGQMTRVVLYDQISRGCFRGTSAAFACDEQAIYWANRFLEFAYSYVIDLDSPICLSYIFIALICLSHSEKKDVQQRSLNLSTQFSQEVLQQEWLNKTTKKQLAKVHSEAKQHYHVIQKFGRFPHRNRALNRKSTAEEKQFLEQGVLPKWMYSQS